METIYEWDIETVDEHGDIQDHHHHDTLFSLLTTLRRWESTDGERYEVVLVRDVGSDAKGIVDRQWRYPFDLSSRLPNEGYKFDDLDGGGVRVPKKYVAEFAKYASELRQLLSK